MNKFGRLIARSLIAATGGYIWYRGYHASAITYFFFLFMNISSAIESAARSPEL